MALSTHVRNTLIYGSSWTLGAPARPPVIRRVLILGQSNGNGTTARAGVDGVVWATLFPGKTVAVRHQGLNWASIAANTCGPLYRVLQLMAAEGDDLTVIRRSINGGSHVSVLDTQLPGARADCAALGFTPADIDLVMLIHGEENSTSAAQAAQYGTGEEQLERIVRICEADFPNAPVALWQLCSTTYGSEWASVRATQQRVVDRRPSVRKFVSTISPSSLTLADGVHFDNAATGYDEGVNRTWAAIAA
jgi:hypothetical protein